MHKFPISRAHRFFWMFSLPSFRTFRTFRCKLHFRYWPRVGYNHPPPPWSLFKYINYSLNISLHRRSRIPHTSFTKSIPWLTPQSSHAPATRSEPTFISQLSKWQPSLVLLWMRWRRWKRYAQHFPRRKYLTQCFVQLRKLFLNVYLGYQACGGRFNFSLPSILDREITLWFVGEDWGEESEEVEYEDKKHEKKSKKKVFVTLSSLIHNRLSIWNH